MEFKSVNKIFEASFKKNWVRPAISNYQGETLCFRDVARRMEKLHIMFEECGLEKGHKVAICSRNQANWAVAFLATMTYGAVPVPLLHEFKSSNIHHLVNHSEAKILFVDDVIWEGLSESEMPDLQAIIQVNTFKLLYSRDEAIVEAREHLNELFGKKYPRSFHPECVSYYEDSPEELAMINYTSGTTGKGKGVMLCQNNFLSDLSDVIPYIDFSNKTVGVLPPHHTYGSSVMFIGHAIIGSEIYLSSGLRYVQKEMKEQKPGHLVMVPLYLETFYRKIMAGIKEKGKEKTVKRMMKLCNVLHLGRGIR